MNPFDSNLDKGLLVNLSSGIAVAEDVAEEITSTDSSGKDDYTKLFSRIDWSLRKSISMTQYQEKR